MVREGKLGEERLMLSDDPDTLYEGFREALTQITRLVDRGEYENALGQAQHWAMLAWTRHFGVFVSPELEAQLGRVGQAVAVKRRQEAPRQRARAAIIMTQAYSVGGHTRIAQRLVELDRERDYTLILTQQGGFPLPSRLTALQQEGKLNIVILQGASLLERAVSLAHELAGFDFVLLNIHPFDVLPSVAITALGARLPVIFIDHASHTFCVGLSVSRIVMPITYTILEQRKGVPLEHVAWVPLPLPLERFAATASRQETRRRLGVPEDAILLLSAGTHYKFLPIEGKSLGPLVAPILNQHPQVHLAIIGCVRHDHWREMKEAYPGRVHLHPLLPETELIDAYHAADVFIDSFPVSSGTTLLEASAAGVPVVRYTPSDWERCGFIQHIETVPPRLYCWQTPELYRRDIMRLITDRDYWEWRARFCRELVHQHHSAETFLFALEDAYQRAREAALINPRPAAVERRFDRLNSLLFKLSQNQVQHVQESTAPQSLDNEDSPDERSRNAYHLWRSRRTLTEVHAEVFAERMMLQWRERPVFVCVIVLEAGQEALLADTLDSLAGQFYKEWRLVVVAPFAAPDPAFNETDQLFWIEAETAEARAEAINGVAASVGANWLWLLPAGARLEPHTFLRFGDYINLTEDWRLIYVDDDRIMPGGDFGEPRFKPDFNLDYARSMDYFGPILVRADALLGAGGASLIEGAEGYDITLRILDAFGEDAIGHIADVLVHLPLGGVAPEVEEAARLALALHLERRGIEASVVEGYQAGTHRVVYALQDQPLVSIIIPNRDKYEFLQPCVESIFEKTAYRNFEVLIVDKQSTDPDVLDYYRQLSARHPGRVRILNYDAEFNFSAMNNLAAREARGEYLLLLNNDTQIVQPEWLERMLAHGQRPEVGVVGARCVYPETGMLQHAGVVLGMMRIADHPFREELGLEEPGYMNRAQVDQNYSAVAAACMLVRKNLYFELGGFDEENFPVLFNDVDLCLRMGQAGYKVVWTPYATVVHHGARSLKDGAVDLMKLALGQERAKREEAAMMARWLPVLARDPAYNPHLSLRLPGYEVEATVVIDWDVNFHDRLRFLGQPLTGGAGEYRVISPFRALSRAGLAHADVVFPPKMFEARILSPVELARAQPDTLLLHAVAGEANLQAMAEYRRFNPEVLLVYGLDDLITQLPAENPFFRRTPRDMRARLRKALGLCDRVIVSTEPLAELCRSLHGDVRVVPNRLEKAIWGGLVSERRQGPRPRVGWAGAQQHAGDLALIVDVVKATASEVDWVFFGMCPDELRPYVREFHEFVVSFYDYPAKLASLNLDLAVAPLALNPFNEAKSNLRLLEYGILGWPVVCTDIYPYQGAPVKRVPNEPAAWIEAIRERVYDPDAAQAEGERLRRWVIEHFMLEDHLDEWMDALARDEWRTTRQNLS